MNLLNTSRVVVVEAQGLYAKAICHVLSDEPAFTFVADLQTVNIPQLQELQPDLLLIDLDGCRQPIVEMMQICREALPNVRVCVLSMRLQPDVMQHCLGAGTDGYVVKDCAPAELIHALKLIADGASYVDARVAGGALRRRAPDHQRGGSEMLSTREADVIRLIAQGLPNKDISARLNLSEKTVKNHISRIFTKLNISARTQAAVYAIRVGLV
ncbi:MAG: response regulator transcription factor [Candidatus Velthaea sp.]